MTTYAMHVSGIHGKLSALDANGFGIFSADTGATFTVHEAETIADDMQPEEARVRFANWAGWPKGDVSIKSRRRSRKNCVVRSLKRKG